MVVCGRCYYWKEIEGGRGICKVENIETWEDYECCVV